jgi:hypothetical protein
VWIIYVGTTKLTLILLMWRIWWAPNNASNLQVGFNLAFKGLRKYKYLMTTKMWCTKLLFCCNTVVHLCNAALTFLAQLMAVQWILNGWCVPENDLEFCDSCMMVRQEGSNVQMVIDWVQAVFTICLLKVSSNLSFA